MFHTAEYHHHSSTNHFPSHQHLSHKHLHSSPTRRSSDLKLPGSERSASITFTSSSSFRGATEGNHQDSFIYAVSALISSFEIVIASPVFPSAPRLRS